MLNAQAGNSRDVFLFAQAPLGVYFNLTISQQKKEIYNYIVFKYNLIN
jgi:hypothetical protein